MSKTLLSSFSSCSVMCTFFGAVLFQMCSRVYPMSTVTRFCALLGFTMYPMSTVTRFCALLGFTMYLLSVGDVSLYQSMFKTFL